MFIIKHKWIFLTISIILVASSLLLVFIKGIKRGIDFTGGTEVVIAYRWFYCYRKWKDRFRFYKRKFRKKIILK